MTVNTLFISFCTFPLSRNSILPLVIKSLRLVFPLKIGFQIYSIYYKKCSLGTHIENKRTVEMTRYVVTCETNKHFDREVYSIHIRHWLEIGENDSPLKQSMVDFEKLYISGSIDKGECVSRKDAHFEHKWKRRERKKVPRKVVSINDLCRRCDVLRVDVELETSKEAYEISSYDSELLYKFMPLLRECLPDVADTVQMEIQPCCPCNLVSSD
ncbi:hypothetical protein MKX01_026706 [Papaver californicum]|nr:hypothetical protein MKX01_026706 [Papaver californicum]